MLQQENDYKVQIGGAMVRVLKDVTIDAEGEFHGHVKTTTLSLELLPSVTSDPRGPELFAKTLIELAHKYDPFKTSRTKVGMLFNSPENNNETRALTITNIKDMKVETIVENMAKMSQSNKSPLDLDAPYTDVVITYLNGPYGSGKRKFDTGDILELTDFGKKQKLDEVDDDETPKSMRSNIMPNEVLADCLPHALYQSLMYTQWKQCRTSENKNKYRNSVRKTYKRPKICPEIYEAVALMKEEAGIKKSSNFDRDDINQFQKTVFACKYQIVVYTQNSTTPYFLGPYVGEGKQLPIYLAERHYSGVRSVCALLKTQYYCFLCDTRYRDSSSHYNCPLLHRLCGQKDCDKFVEGEEFQCKKCTVKFYSRKCYENHNKKGPQGGRSRCDYTKSCKRCREVYYTNKNKNEHRCGEKWCYRCNCKRTKQHQCIMPKSKRNEKKLTHRRVFFDIESRADEKTGLQTPVLFVALRCCKECSSIIPKDLQNVKNETCVKCAPDGRLKIIECITPENKDVNVAEELTKWLFADHHKDRVVVAHNASGYDAQFILENLISRHKAPPKLILDGTKLVFMEYNNVRMLDSMKFLTMSLSSMGRAFEVDSHKGDFPVNFIRPENYGYSGPLPENEFYAMKNKSSDAKKKLVAYLDEERAAGKQFNFYDEIMKYCFNDVYILASSMTKFEKAFEDMTNVCLLEESTTAASAAVLVFRRNHLDDEKPIYLDAKPSVSINCSVISQKYLAWLGKNEGVQVNMSTTYGEQKVGKYRVDGFIDKCPEYPDGQIIEFNGCYYHGHSCTYSQESIIGGKTVREIRQKDEERIKKLTESYPVKIVWECEVNKELSRNQDMAEFFERYEPVGILHCEKSLVGGRTELFKLYCNNVAKLLRYLDVVSLYPTVMKHETFPIGPPENVPCSEMMTPMTTPNHIHFRGFLSCRVLPPKQLKLPLLPIKSCGKLIFGLCNICATSMNPGECHHTDDQRSFNGTFTTAELTKALSLGYVITEVYHGVKYEHWVQNNERGEGGLFTSYINQMMEEKIYSSGWPSNVQTDEEKRKFCQGYLEKEHIRLDDYSRFKKNPGKRAVAKLMLNSLWGKFAQNVDRTTTTVTGDAGQFWKLLHETRTVVATVRVVKDVLIVEHMKQVETLESLKTSAMQLASYTTSYARLRLYRFMEMVGPDNIVYTDTDSIIYAVPDGTSDPLEKEVGSYLGQLTDELEGQMTEFVSLGPKTYSYKDVLKNDEEKVVRKTKGITLNCEADKLITFDTMKKMVEEVLRDETKRTVQQIPQFTMVRNKNHQVFSKDVTKAFKYTFNKRRVLPDGSTLPYGFKL